jgi:hypothetical protein
VSIFFRYADPVSPPGDGPKTPARGMRRPRSRSRQERQSGSRSRSPRSRKDARRAAAGTHRRRSRSPSRSSDRGGRKRRNPSRSRSRSRDRRRRPRSPGPTAHASSGGVVEAIQKLKEATRGQLRQAAAAAAPSQRGAAASDSGWVRATGAAAVGLVAEEYEEAAFRPSALLAHARMVEAVRSEEVEEVAAAAHSFRPGPRAAQDDKHWDAMFSAPTALPPAAAIDESDAASIDSDALFDPQVLEADATRPQRWAATVRRINEEKRRAAAEKGGR